MAVPRLRVPSSQHQAAGLSSDEVELYHRTYTTLLRSSGETLVRVLEPSHRAMNSSLHPLAASEDLDLGAFLYATRRLPDEVADAKVIVMGQEAIVFKRNGIGPIEEWEPLEAPARRRRWFHDGEGTLAVLLASASDLDDLIPTLVAYQIEWNKLRVKLRAAERLPDAPSPAQCAAALGGSEEDWSRLRSAWGEGFAERMRDVARAPAQPARADARRQRRRLRAHDPPLVAAGARDPLRAGPRRPPDLLRLLQPALDRQPAHRHRARARAGDRRVGRAAPRTPTSCPSSSASAPARPRARGRTSSTSPRASTSAPTRRTRTSSSSARARSARSASPTSRARPRCASRPRSSTCAGSTRRRSTRGWASATWPRPTR